MGLLDFMQTPAGLGLVSGIAGYAANARRGTPINNIGRGFAAGVSGYQGAKEQQAQIEQMQQVAQMRQMQAEQFKLANEQRVAQQNALANAPEDVRNAVAMGVPIAEIWKRQNPERKLETLYDDSGREQKGYVNPDGSFTPVGGAKKDQTPWYVRQGPAGQYSIDPAYADLEKTKASFARPPAQPMQPIAYVDQNGQTVWGTIAEARGKPAANFNPSIQGQLAQAKGYGTETGKGLADAESNLPKAISNGETALSQIEELRKHPGFSIAVGKTSMLGTQKIPGTDGYDFVNRLEQLKGGAFLNAFESLKGGGQITEVEGKKATAAIARMDNATSEQEFNSALTDYENVIKKAVNNAKMRAGKNQTPVQNAPRSGVKFLGFE